MTDCPTTKLRWLGSVRGPLFLPELRHIPPPNTPLMITSQHPPRIVIQTLKRSWNGRDVAAGVLTTGIFGAVHPLILQGGEERFGHRIVIANPCAASRVPDLVILQRPREPGRSVIAAAAAVEYRALGERVIAG